ncbi:MAG TPA: HlyD family efflux transporter periplasmic adaptor subunit [Thermoanaerobaculia bacterium]
MDRELGSGYRRGRLVRRVGIAAGLLALGTVVFVALPGWLRPSIDRERLRTGFVDRGPVEGVIEASGTVVPAFEKVLSSPVEARVDRILVRPGATVAPGDEILALDTAASRLELDRLDDLVAQKESEREELRLGLEEELASLSSRIESGRLDAEILRYRLEQEEKLHAEGLLAEEALREAEVAAEKAAIELRQLEESLERTRRTHAARLRGLELDLDILRGERDASRRELELAGARADRAGVLTWVIPEEGATVQRGEVLARIADLDSFRVEATVSDIHASRLAEGQPVRVLLDGEPVGGRLEGVHPTIQNGVVRFDVSLEEPAHPKLRNNLRVDVLVVTGHRANALRLPRASFAGGGAVSPVFVIEGGQAQKRPARLGLVGYEHVEVLDGLQAGQEVILSDMSDYLHLDEIQIDE